MKKIVCLLFCFVASQLHAVKDPRTIDEISNFTCVGLYLKHLCDCSTDLSLDESLFFTVEKELPWSIMPSDACPVSPRKRTNCIVCPIPKRAVDSDMVTNAYCPVITNTPSPRPRS